MTERTTTIYVMALTQGKYYVGRSDAPDDRILSHFAQNGSVWTKMYPPERVVLKLEDADVFDEDKMTKKYMHKYGVDNVRGASYCQLVLSAEQLGAIKRELANVDDRCFKCGKEGHFVNACTTTVETEDDVASIVTIMKRVTLSSPSTTTPRRCYGCGSEGHFVANCSLKRRARECARCGRDSHKTMHCYAKTNIKGEALVEMNKPNPITTTTNSGDDA